MPRWEGGCWGTGSVQERQGQEGQRPPFPIPTGWRKKGKKGGESGIPHRPVPEGRLREGVALCSAQETFCCLLSHLRLQEKTSLKCISLAPLPKQEQPRTAQTEISGLVGEAEELGRGKGGLKDEIFTQEMELATQRQCQLAEVPKLRTGELKTRSASPPSAGRAESHR